MPIKVSDEITYPFPNYNGSIVEAWEWISNSSHTCHGFGPVTEYKLETFYMFDVV